MKLFTTATIIIVLLANLGVLALLIRRYYRNK